MSRIVEHKKYLLVEVPEDATDFVIQKVQGIKDKYLIWYSSKIDWAGQTRQYLPSGSYTIIGKADQLKDSDWEGIVEWIKPKVMAGNFKDYLHDGYIVGSPTQSGLSLLASHDMKAEQVLIIKKI